MDLERIEALLRLLNDLEVAEFSFEDEDIKMKVKLGPMLVHGLVAAPAPIPQTAAPAPAPAEPSEAPAPDDDLQVISSPMVGTFYRASGPEVPPFIEVGQTVKQGQVVCIIEAMKLMNEIETDVDGVIVSIDVDNAQPVQFGQALVGIRPS